MHTLTTKEVCDILGRSDKSVQRYVKEGKLRPETIKSERGTPEYRFDREEVEKMKDQTPRSPASGVSVLHETVRVLSDQLTAKDRQIDTKDQQIQELSNLLKEMVERDREKNLLLKDMQDKVTLLLPGQGGKTGRPETSHSPANSQDAQLNTVLLQTKETQDTQEGTMSSVVRTVRPKGGKKRQDTFFKRFFPSISELLGK